MGAELDLIRRVDGLRFRKEGNFKSDLVDFRISHGGEAEVAGGGSDSVANDALPGWFLRKREVVTDATAELVVGSGFEGNKGGLVGV